MVLRDGGRFRITLLRTERRSVVGWNLECGAAWFCCDFVGAGWGEDCCVCARASVEASVVAAARKSNFLIDASIEGRIEGCVGKTTWRGSGFEDCHSFCSIWNMNVRSSYLKRIRGQRVARPSADVEIGPPFGARLDLVTRKRLRDILLLVQKGSRSPWPQRLGPGGQRPAN